MSRLMLTGVNSQIIKELKSLLPRDQECLELSRTQCDMGNLAEIDCWNDFILSCDKFVLAHGSVSGKPFQEQEEAEILESLKVNLLSVVRICEIALQNPLARIVVIGSESGKKGSYDINYWLSKAALHSYVKERRLNHPDQQLVCVSPCSVIDAGMTRRKSEDLIEKSIQSTSKERGLTSLEVAKCIHHLLFVDKGYTTNTVVEIYGGKFSRRQV